MKAKKLFIALIFLILLTGCVQDDITNPVAGCHTITITAGLPGESAGASENGTDLPGTRIALIGNYLNVKLTWEVGDVVYLVYTQGDENKGKQAVTLTADNITEGGKKASFGITIPETFLDEPFNLYGVYGGTGFDGETYNLKLLAAPWSGKTLEEVQNKDVTLLRFAAEGISMASPSFTVAFVHVGSLFHIRLFNSSNSALNGITKAELVAETTIQAHQNGGSATYNPVTGTFTGTSTSGTSLPFDIATTSLDPIGILHFWGWYPPVADQNWPALSLGVTTAEGSYTSTNSKPARATATAAGKAYHFYACYNGANLSFTSRSENEGYFVDDRDENVYGTVTIGDQTWMKENLAYLPSVVGSNKESQTEAYLYVYGYEGTDVAAAKATDNYKTYGVLYNWPAAMSGAASSAANPSGVQGICPSGWHLPSNEEWIQLETYLMNNGYNYDGTTGGLVRAKIAKSMATDSGWGASTNPAAVGNTDYPAYRNKSGFSALPGGYLPINDTFSAIGSCGYWWSSSKEGMDYVWRRVLSMSKSDVLINQCKKMSGQSVRCLRDS